jgi:hypothetical protein
MSDPHLAMGPYWVDLECPECGEVVAVAVSLASVLTAPSDAVATLKLKAKSGKVDHMCNQLRLDIAGITTP